MATGNSRERYTWEPGQKAPAVERWFLNVLSDVRLSRGSLRTAGVLMFGFNSNTGGCWRRKTVLAAAAGVSVSSVKQALSELDEHGHILRIQETVRGTAMRVIYPVLNPDIENQERRARRGGVPKGVDPRQRSAENAARKGVPSLDGEGPFPLLVLPPAPVAARPVLDAAPQPIPGPKGDSTPMEAALPLVSSDAPDQESTVEAKPMTVPNLKNDDYPAGGLPYWRVNIMLDHQGFRPKPRRLTADQIRELSQAWADGEFDIVAERLTGEGPIHQSSLRTEGQSGNGSKAVSPSIQEQSINIIPHPIPERCIQPEQVVVGCSHTGCRVPARFRSLSNGDLLCIRHRGGGVSCAEL